MNFLDSRLYQALKIFADFFILNLIWLTVCLPILTIFPATAAMFGVCREWTKGRNSDVVETYFALFKDEFKQSLCVGLAWGTVGGLLLANYSFLSFNSDLIRDLPMSAKFPLYMWSVLTGLIYVFTSLYLFPVMVNYDMSWLGVLKTSALLSASRPITTLLCTLTLVGSVALLRFFPATLAMVGSVTAYVIYRLCDQVFKNVTSLRG